MFIYENKGLLFPVNICASVCECAGSAQVYTCASGLSSRTCLDEKKKRCCAAVLMVCEKVVFSMI